MGYFLSVGKATISLFPVLDWFGFSQQTGTYYLTPWGIGLVLCHIPEHTEQQSIIVFKGFRENKLKRKSNTKHQKVTVLTVPIS